MDYHQKFSESQIMEDTQQERDALAQLSEEMARIQHESEMIEQEAKERHDKLEELAKSRAEA